MAEEELAGRLAITASRQSCSLPVAQKEEEEEEEAGEDREEAAGSEREPRDGQEEHGGPTRDGGSTRDGGAADSERCGAGGEEVGQDGPESSGQRDEDLKQVRRMTPDFPDALYELLCTLQEGRRLNDQRCSFSLQSAVPRRRCHSEPNTTKPAARVAFSSMTSLQREEFFELVATAQARRLDDQRAKLGRSPAPKSKSRSFRGSIKQLSLVRKAAPLPVPKEDLYNMILSTQAQGRLEDQRSRAPGPMDDDDFFSLLLKVQGGRMDEQRTELPIMLQS